LLVPVGYTPPFHDRRANLPRYRTASENVAALAAFAAEARAIVGFL